MLISSAVMVSAQEQVRVTREVDVSGGPLGFAAQKVDAKVSPDEVVARLMSFDSNRDGKIAVNELSERMQGLVARGDRGGDGALDAAEIRSLAVSPQFVQTAFRNVQGGGYSFGDTVGLSTRSHIENTIEDLRLTPQANEQARLIASAFADELEGTALANLKRTLSPVLTEQQLATFEANVTRSAGSRTVQLSSNGTMQTIVLRGDPTILLLRQQMPPEQMKTVAAAVETFKADQQLDDARRSALVARVSGILTDEERDNFSAALARRPLVKGLGTGFTFQVAVNALNEAIREFPGNGVPVREIGFDKAPAPQVEATSWTKNAVVVPWDPATR
jgi:hypothetical protein